MANSMKDFQKFVQKGERIQRKNSRPRKMQIPAASWLGNITKSLGYSSLDTFSKIMPNSIEFAKSAAEGANEVKDALSTAKDRSKEFQETMNKNDYVQMIKELKSNVIADLKSGNFYNKERQQKFISDQMGGDMGDFDFGDDFNFDTDSDDEWESTGDFESTDDGASVSVKSAKKGESHVTQVAMSNDIGPDSALVQSTNYQTQVVTKGLEATMNTMIGTSQAMMTLMAKVGDDQSRSITAVNTTIADVGEKLHSKLTELAAISEKYYNDSIAIATETRDLLKEIRGNTTATAATSAARDPKTINEALDLIGSGGVLNFSEYRKYVGKNFKSWAESDFMASTIMSMFQEKDALRHMIQAPLQFLVEGVTKQLIPRAMQSAMKGFDAMLGEFTTTALTQLASLRNSSNPIMSFLGEVFGLRQDMKTTFDKSNYNKGAVAFDGLAHRAITEVIPTYLSQIAATLKGQEEMVFDYNAGQFRSLRSVQEDYDKRIRSNKLSPFGDDVSQFNEMLKTSFTASTKEEIEDYKKTFENLLIKMVNQGGMQNYRQVVGRDGKVTDELADMLGLSPDDNRVKTIRGFLEGRTALPGGNALNARMFGTSVHEARAAVSKTNRDMETSPLLMNGQYVRNGMEGVSNSHMKFARKGEKGSRDRAIAGGGGVGSLGGFDKFGKTQNDYLYSIMTTLMKGINVAVMNWPASPNRNQRRNAKRDQQANSTSGTFDYSSERGHYKVKRDEVSKAETIRSTANNKYDSEKQKGKIDLGGDLTEEQVQLAASNSLQEELGDNATSRKASLLERLAGIQGSFGEAMGKLNDRIQNGSGKITGAIRSADNFLYNLLFGDGKKNGLRYTFQFLLDGVKAQLGKMGKWIGGKILKPIGEFLFDKDNGLFTKIKESDFISGLTTGAKSLMDSIGNKIFGTKVTGPDGKTHYEGGLVSETMTAFSDMGRAARDMILGQKGPDGKPLPLADDHSALGAVKRLLSSASTTIAEQLGINTVKEDGSKMTFAEMAKSAVDFTWTRMKNRASEFMDNMFGKSSDETEGGKKNDFINNARDLLSTFREEMRGKGGNLVAGGMLGAVGVPIISSSMGLMGSLFLPGGPIGGALIGTGISFIANSETLKTKLFGEKDDNGERMGGIVSKDFQQFFKDHKIGIGVGAGLGIGAGLGLLPSWFLPGGPIGGALIGAGISMVTKSQAFNDFLYGPGGTKDDPTGGLSEKFKKIFGSNKDLKGLAADTAMGAGVGLVGSFFLPGGPIVGALLGSAASIITNTNAFKKLMFGDEEFDEEGNSLGRNGGLWGKFTGLISTNIFSPLMKRFEKAQADFLFFMEDRIYRPLATAFAPISNKVMEGAEAIVDLTKSMVSSVGDYIKGIVLEPVGEAFKTYIINPLKKIGDSLLGMVTKVVGNIIAAPFAVIGAIGQSIFQSDLKRGSQSAVESAKAKRNEDAMALLRSGNIFGAASAFAKGTAFAHSKANKEAGKWSKEGAGRYATAEKNPETEDKRIHNKALEDRARRYAAIEEKYGPLGASSKKLKRASKQKNSQIATAERINEGNKLNEQQLSEAEVTNNTLSEINENQKGFFDKLLTFLTGKPASVPSPTTDTTVIPPEGESTDTTPNTTKSRKKARKDKRNKKKNRNVPAPTPVASQSTVIPEPTDNGTTTVAPPTAADGSTSSAPPSGKGGIADNVSWIRKFITGNLDGVGYNVNKIYSLLLKKFNETDENIKGGANKRYRGIFGRIQDFLTAPIRAITNVVTAPFKAVKSILTGAKDAVVKFGKGLAAGGKMVLETVLSIPKQLLGILTEVFKIGGEVIRDGLKVASSALVTGIKVAGGLLITGVETLGTALKVAGPAIGKAVGSLVKGLGDLAGGIISAGGSVIKGIGELGKGIATGVGKLLPMLFEGFGKLAKGGANLVGGIATGIGNVLGGKKRKGLFGGKVQEVYVIGGTLDKVKVVETVKNVNLSEFRSLKERLARLEGGNGGFGGGGFGESGAIQKVYIDGGKLDSVEEVSRVASVGEIKSVDELSESAESSWWQRMAAKFDAVAGTDSSDATTVSETESPTPIMGKLAEFTDRISSKIFGDKKKDNSEGSSESIIAAREADEQQEKLDEREDLQTKLLHAISSHTGDLSKNFSGIFSKKGLIGSLLLFGLPLLIHFFKNFDIGNVIKQIGDSVSSAIKSVIGLGDSKTGAGANGTGIATDENGIVILDENGKPVSNPAEASKGIVNNVLGTFFRPSTEQRKDGTYGTVYKWDNKSGALAKHVGVHATQAGIAVGRGVKKATDIGGKAWNLAKNSKLGKGIANYVGDASAYSNLYKGFDGTREAFNEAVGGGNMLGKAMTKVDDAVVSAKGAVNKLTGKAGQYFGDAATFADSYKSFKLAGIDDALEMATNNVGGQPNKLGKALTKVDDTLGALKNSKVGKSVADAASSLKNSKVGQKVSGIVPESKGLLSKFKGLLDEAIEAITKLIEKFMLKNGGAANKGFLTGVTAVFKKLSGAISESSIGKFASKITTAITKFASGFSPAVVANVVWGGLAFVNANPAQVFQVSAKDVDWKMQAIARLWKSFMSLSFMTLLDVAFEIANSILGIDIGSEICCAIYKGISSEKNDTKLDNARAEFKQKYNESLEESYALYAQACQDAGQDAMSFEDWQSSGLADTFNEFNQKENQTIGGKIMNGLGKTASGIKGIGSKISSGTKAIGASFSGGVKGIGASIKGFGSSIIGGAKNLASKGSNALSSFVAPIAPLANKVGDVLGGVKDLVSVPLTAYTSTMKNAITKGTYGDTAVKIDEKDPLGGIKKILAIAGKLSAILPGGVAIVGHKVASSVVNTIKTIGDLASVPITVFTGTMQSAIRDGNFGGEMVTIDENDPLGGIKRILAVGSKLAAIVPGSIAILGRGIVHKVQETWDKVKSFGSSVINVGLTNWRQAISGVTPEKDIVAGEGAAPTDYMLQAFDGMTAIALTPVAGAVKLGKGLIENIMKVWGKVKSFTGDVTTIVGTHWSNAIQGKISTAESVTLGEGEPAPTDGILGFINKASAVLLAPVAGVVSVGKIIGEKVGGFFGGIENILSNIGVAANVFDKKVTMKNYFKPDFKTDTISGMISSVLFYVVRGLMSPLFILKEGFTKLVENGGDLVNSLLEKLGLGSAFTVVSNDDSSSSDDGGSGGFGGSTYVSQNDPSLATQPYKLSNGQYDTFGNRGCGPAAMTMVANKMGGNVSPLQVAKDSTDGGYSTDVGTRKEFFNHEANRLGMKSSQMPATEGNLKKNLGGFGPVILQGADNDPQSPFTSKGHYVVANAVGNGMVDIDDPRGRRYSGLYPIDKVTKGASNMWAFGNKPKPDGGYGPANDITSSVVASVNPTNSMMGKSKISASAAAKLSANTLDAKCTPKKIVLLASKEVGYLEKASNSDLDDKTANAGKSNYTKYNRDLFGTASQFWCAAFVSWIFHNACDGDTSRRNKVMCGGISAACNELMGHFKSAGRFDSNPQIGDMIFFTGKRHSGANHIGIVVGVAGNIVYTIEGNTSGGAGVVDNGGGVFVKSYQIGSGNIIGYGHPVFEADSPGYTGITSADGVAAAASSGGSTIAPGSSSYGVAASSSSSSSSGGGLAAKLMSLGNAMLNPIMKAFGLGGTDDTASSSSYGEADVNNSTGSYSGASSIVTTDGDYIGKHVKKFESGSKGSDMISSGKGDNGGVSFGSYQFPSYKKEVTTEGSLPAFWNKYYAQQYPDVKPGNNEAFKNAWRSAVAKDPSGFFNNEHGYIYDQYYLPSLNAMKGSSVGDIDSYDRAAQEAMWSTSVQYGGGKSTKNMFEGAGVKTTMEPGEFIKKLYDYKISTVPTKFKSSSESVRSSIVNRFKEEAGILQSLAGHKPIGKDVVSQTSLDQEKNAVVNNGGDTTTTGVAEGSTTKIDAPAAIISKVGAANVSSNIAANALNKASGKQLAGMGGFGGMPTVSKDDPAYSKLMLDRQKSEPRYIPEKPKKSFDVEKFAQSGGFGDTKTHEMLGSMNSVLNQIAENTGSTSSGVAGLSNLGNTTNVTNNEINVSNGKGEVKKAERRNSIKDRSPRDRTGYAAAKKLSSGNLIGSM